MTFLDNKPKYHDFEYLRLVSDVLRRGIKKDDRTGTGTRSLFAQQMRFDLSFNSIPLLTTKKMFVRGIIREILWYLDGCTNSKELEKYGVNIWREWANENGELGPIYGKMWRSWPGKIVFEPGRDDCGDIVKQQDIDQIQRVIDLLRNNPDDRRIIVNAWNPTFLPEDGLSFEENVARGNQALPPCHAMFQFWSRELSDVERQTISEEMNLDRVPDRALSCHLYQRSCDLGLGVPFNIVQYSILTHMIAQVTGHIAEEFVWTGGDVHIYENHIEMLNEQITRRPYPSPRLWLNPDVSSIDDFKFEDFAIIDYNHHPTIKMEVSV